MHFLRLKVRTRIYLGFSVLIVLGLGLAGFSVRQLSGIGVDVGKMDVLAANTQRVLTASRDFEAIRGAGNRYLLDGADSALDRLHNAIGDIRTQLTAAAQIAVSQERAKMFSGVVDALTPYEQLLARFVLNGIGIGLFVVSS